MDEKREFYDVVDQFINLANSLVPAHGTARVSATILFAASRFNAFNYYAVDGQSETREEMIEYYCDQYRQMLLDNLDWLAESMQNEK